MKLLDRTIRCISPRDEAARARAKARLDQLTMPRWALGRLMDLAMDLSGMTGSVPPAVSRKAIVTMAGDHGVVAEGVSGYPPEVTRQMVFNFVRGGAAINVLARLNGASVVVVDMGVAGDLGELVRAGGIVSKRLAGGTGNIARGPAMTGPQAIRAVEAGIEVVDGLADAVDVFGVGDMGIGNTTPSAAIAAAITGAPAADVTGRGTGLDDARLARKVAIVRRALELNGPDPSDGLDVLAKVGGFEIGGIAGVVLGAAARRKPVVIDGFIAGAGALIAQALAPAAADYVIAAHRSAEPGHAVMLRQLDKEPLLTLGLRLGEGTGAALAMNLVDAAAAILTGVSTFDEAAVSRAVP